ncbi:MAG TPA: hypothetical protein VEF53_14025 [Patescibacteria group bacterium]|nr:hypothetical protein [Patescibacteria group bacterium]
MKYVLYVLLTTVLTMLLIYAGYMKEKTLPFELTNRLFKKCSKKIHEYLSENEEASIIDLKKCIKDVRASVYWSRKKVSVTNPDQFIEVVTENMMKQGLLKARQQNGKILYYLISENK